MACQPAEGPAQAAQVEPSVHVETVTVEARLVPHFLSLTGSVVANQDSAVAADATGKVLAVYVERGTVIQKGAPIARLDTRGALLSQVEARAQLGAARAENDRARSDCQRSESLFRDNALNRADYERTCTQSKAAEWSVATASARASIADKFLEDAIIRAPFSGLVATKWIGVGEYVHPDTKVIELVELDPVRLELTVPEASVNQIREGLAVDFTVSAFSEHPFHTAVRYVGPAVRRTSRDLIIEAVVPNADKALRPGMFAAAQLKLGEESTPVVPQAAIRDDGSTSRVYVAQSGRLEERLIQVGTRLGDFVAVDHGLKAGEKVAARADTQLHDGLRIE